MSIYIMTTDTRPKTSSWIRSLSRRKKSPQDSRASPQPDGLLVPRAVSRSSDSEETLSTPSSTLRGRRSFREMVSKIRSSPSAASVDGRLQESDFKMIEDWFDGFAKYNRLVVIRISQDQSFASEEFLRLSKILTKNCGGGFMHSLPEAAFDFALLWCPAETLARKDIAEPSWSWTGWQGLVNFPFDPTSCPDLHTMPTGEGEWFRSEIQQFHVGPLSAPYTVRRAKDRKLRIYYPPYFHAPRGFDASADSHVLRFATFAIPADGFSAEQLHYGGKEIPCSHLLNSKDQHCGVIMDFKSAISEPCSTGPFEFVLLSRNLRREPATSTKRPSVPIIHPPGTPIWDGESFLWDEQIVDFDEDLFEDGPWKVLNVMLIKWNGDYAERVAIARIHEDAWKNQNPVKKEIVLR